MTADTASAADVAPLAGPRPGLRRRLERAAPFLPGLAMLTLLFVIPMFIMLAFSFWKTNSSFDLVRDWKLNNYARFFNQPTYIRTFAKTLVMSSAVTAPGLAISLPFSSCLVRSGRLRFQRPLQHILLPQTRTGIITACIFVFIPILGKFLTPTLVGGASGSLIANLIVNFTRQGQFPEGAALAIVIAVFVTILLVVFRRSLRVEDVVARG